MVSKMSSRGPVGDRRTGALVGAERLELLERAVGHAEAERLPPVVATVAYVDLELAAQRVDDRDAHAVQATGHLVAAAAELAAGVQHGQRHRDRRHVLAGGRVGGDAAAVVLDADAAVVLQGHRDAGGVAGQRLVDGVVDDLPHEVVQAALAGGADVHAGALADGLEPLEDLDRGRVVLALLDRVALAHRGEGGGRLGDHLGGQVGAGDVGVRVADGGSVSLSVLVAGGVLAGMSSATSHPLHVCTHKEGRPRNRENDHRSVYPVEGSKPRLCSPAEGVHGVTKGDSRPHRVVWAAAQGRFLVPIPARVPQIGSQGRSRTTAPAVPGLSRRCRADPGRRAPTAGRASRSGRADRAPRSPSRCRRRAPR